MARYSLTVLKVLLISEISTNHHCWFNLEFFLLVGNTVCDWNWELNLVHCYNNLYNHFYSTFHLYLWSTKWGWTVTMCTVTLLSRGFVCTFYETVFGIFSFCEIIEARTLYNLNQDMIVFVFILQYKVFCVLFSGYVLNSLCRCMWGVSTFVSLQSCCLFVRSCTLCMFGFITLAKSSFMVI